MAAPTVPVPGDLAQADALATRTLIDLRRLKDRWQDYQGRHQRGPDPLRQMALSEPPDLLASPLATSQIAVSIIHNPEA